MSLSFPFDILYFEYAHRPGGNSIFAGKSAVNVSKNKLVRKNAVTKGILLYDWICFRHAIGQFAVRNFIYGPQFLKKMLISEL